MSMKEIKLNYSGFYCKYTTASLAEGFSVILQRDSRLLWCVSCLKVVFLIMPLKVFSCFKYTVYAVV